MVQTVSSVLLVTFAHQRITNGYCLLISSEIKPEYNDKYFYSSSVSSSFFLFFIFAERHK